MERRSKRKGQKGSSSSTARPQSPPISTDSEETSRDSFMTSETAGNAEQQIQIGKVYMVRRINGQWLPGEILETRQVESRGNRLEYYVHFENHDKRLDEWVDAERIDLFKGDIATNAKNAENEDVKENLAERKFTRQQRKKTEMVSNSNNQLINELDPETAQLEKEREELTKVKYIEKIQLGKYEIDTWYFSPYPEDYGKATKLYICEFCLKYMKAESTYKYHLHECSHRSPPGKEIYHKNSLSVFEANGVDHKLYCQCLTLLAKLFLDHKTLYYDVSPFIFYILTEVDKNGCHLVGYFSKEIDSSEGNNLACILTLPPYQRKGYGKFLIAFSYLLTRMEGTCGSPEKPLSDLGKLSYQSYWSYTLLNILKENGILSVDELSKRTGFTKTDIVETLSSYGLIKYWKRENTVCVTPKQIEEILRTLERSKSKQPQVDLDPACLVWQPPGDPSSSTSSSTATAMATKGGTTRLK